MKPWRQLEIVLVLLAMLAWTVYSFVFFFTLAVPPLIEGAAEAEARTRLTIVGGWLAGIAIGSIALLGLWRGTFDQAPWQLRVRLAVGGFVAGVVLVVALYWLELAGMLVFLWAPLVAGVLLLIGWASPPPLRRRLRLALGGWLLGFAALATLWFILPPGTLQFHFWTLLALITLAAAASWAWALLVPRALHGASR